MARKRDLWICLLLSAAVWLAFAGVLANGFVDYDDPMYLGGDHGPSVAGLVWALLETHRADMWHPLTWWSLFFDAFLYGSEPWGYHLTNLLLHNANTLLVFAVWGWATGRRWCSAAVAALFALHPLHVESVAWVSERKDVLSTFFYLLAILAYLSFSFKPRRDRYLLLLLAFAAALMSKPMAVTLPCTLLLLDFWPLRRYAWQTPDPERVWQQPKSVKSLVVEKLPLFAMAGVVALLTVIVMHDKGVLRSLNQYSLGERAAIAVVAYVTYLRQMLWPVDLAPFYPLPTPYSPLEIGFDAIVLLALSGLAIWQMRRRPYLFVGWCWYLGILFPVCGLVKFASFAHADRFTYLPLVGIFVTLVWLAAEWRSTLGRTVVTCVTLAILLSCMALTRRQVDAWNDDFSLWRHTLRVGHDSYVARYRLGDALRRNGQPLASLEHYRAAARLSVRPRDLRGLSRTFQDLGDLDFALFSLRQAASLEPGNAHTQERLAEILELLGQSEAAAEERKRFEK